MDPNANLEEQLRLAAEIQAIIDDCDDNGDNTPEQDVQLIASGARLAELVIALNEWIQKGGFLPGAWRK
jgi:hypothetical protein